MFGLFGNDVSPFVAGLGFCIVECDLFFPLGLDRTPFVFTNDEVVKKKRTIFTTGEYYLCVVKPLCTFMKRKQCKVYNWGVGRVT